MTNRTKIFRPRTVAAAAGIAVAGATMSVAAAAPAKAATELPTVLQKIRYCESGNDYTAQNSSSSASGAYQFLTSTWQSLSASAGYATAASAPASVQDAAALELYNEAGTSPWAASQSCWGSLTSVPSSTTTSSSSSTSSSSTSSSSTASSTSSTSSSSGSTSSSSSSTRSARYAKAGKIPAKAGHGVNKSTKPGRHGHHQLRGAHHAAALHR